MDDMFSRISQILDDPEQAEKIKQIASSFADPAPSAPSVTAKSEIQPDSAVSDRMKRNITLLNAIKPYMRPSRADKINSAIKAVQLINVLGRLK